MYLVNFTVLSISILDGTWNSGNTVIPQHIDYLGSRSKDNRSGHCPLIATGTVRTATDSSACLSTLSDFGVTRLTFVDFKDMVGENVVVLMGI
jgi:hypothetical protein